MSDFGYSEADKREDVIVLHNMGYAQELERRLSRFSNFAVSFSIICILSGGINSLPQTTSGAGGIAIGIGWLVGCFVSLTFAVAMSQIASAYPTAGGLYHWGSILGNRGTGWVTAWLNLLGLITVLGAINVGTWTFFIGAFGAKLGIENTLTNQTIFLIAITGAQALINHLGIKLTAQLTDFSGWLIFGGSILIGIVCLWAADSWEVSRLFSPKYRTPVAAIWTGAVLSVLFVWGSSLISVAGTSAYTIVVSCTVIFLFLSFTFPIVLGALAWGTPKWDKMGPWNLGRGVFMLFALLSVLSMLLILVIGVQPPNDKALWIVIGFFILTAVVWFGFEKRRFQGPPLGDIIAKRQAMIKEAEAAVGETIRV